MALAFDAVSSSAQGIAALSWTHTPVGTPAGILVEVVTTPGLANEVTGATYGGVAMTEVVGSPNVQPTGAGEVVNTFFLGSGIPAGAQTVVVSVSGADTKRAVAISITAAVDTEVVVVNAAINADSQANPSVTLPLGRRACFCAIALGSGQNAVTGISPLAGWTSRLTNDFGSQVGGWYTYDTIGPDDVTAGWTQLADDTVAIAIAIGEVGVAPVPLPVVGGGSPKRAPWHGGLVYLQRLLKQVDKKIVKKKKETLAARTETERLEVHAMPLKQLEQIEARAEAAEYEEELVMLLYLLGD